jgi:hypothetical protein
MTEVTFVNLTVEARTEVIKEAAEESAWAIESTDKKLARLAELLKQQKGALGHGKWLPWIRETFGDSDSAIWKVQRWMRGKSNNAPAHYLDLGEDQPDVAESAIVPRAERKTGRVEVEKVGQPIVQADPPKPEKDDDPNPAPKTNTKHSPVTAKAKEADRPAPQIVTPVIVEEPEATKEPEDPFRYCTFDTIIEIAIGKLSDSDDQRKQAARRLRKLADKLDPPKPSSKFQRPDLDECLEFFQEHDSNQGETFFDFYESKGWLVGKVSMKNWQAAGRKWIRENQQNGINSNGRQSAAQAREQSNADSFAQLRLAISQEQSGET